MLVPRFQINPGDVFMKHGLLFYRDFDGGSGLKDVAKSSCMFWGNTDEVDRVFEYRATASAVPRESGQVSTGPVEAPLSAQPHYTTLSPEPIDVIEGWGLDKDFYLSNAIKYIARAGRKPGEPAEKDLNKAIRYLRRKVNRLAGKASWD